MAPTPQKQTLSTSWGDIVISILDEAVIACRLPHVDTEPAIPFRIEHPGNDPYSRYVFDLFKGDSPERPPVSPLNGTPFQRKVWDGLLQVPRGETRTYGGLARELGCDRAYRAVASACGRNPSPLFIPCHRIVGAQGGLGGFSAGLAWKRLLLEREGFPSIISQRDLHRPIR